MRSNRRKRKKKKKLEYFIARILEICILTCNPLDKIPHRLYPRDRFDCTTVDTRNIVQHVITLHIDRVHDKSTRVEYFKRTYALSPSFETLRHCYTTYYSIPHYPCTPATTFVHTAAKKRTDRGN